MKKINIGVYFSLLAILFFLHLDTNAQQRKITKEAFQITDAATGKSIPEVLIIPLYFSAKGVFVAPEGPAKGSHRYYLDKPFLYRTGEPFILKTPKFSGLPLFMVMVGKGRTLERILIVAPQYRPVWFENLWDNDLWGKGDARKLQMTPIPENEWLALSEKQLNPLTKDASLPKENLQLWNLPAEEPQLYIYYDKKERELVRSFLKR